MRDGKTQLHRAIKDVTKKRECRDVLQLRQFSFTGRHAHHQLSYNHLAEHSDSKVVASERLPRCVCVRSTSTQTHARMNVLLRGVVTVRTMTRKLPNKVWVTTTDARNRVPTPTTRRNHHRHTCLKKHGQQLKQKTNSGTKRITGDVVPQHQSDGNRRP